MKYFLSLLRQLLFWLFFFAAQRALFLIYYSHQLRIQEISFPDLLFSFAHALKLDISTACYILTLPLIILIIQFFLGGNWLNKVNRAYTFVILTVYLFVSIGEIGLYGEWNTKLSYKALVYLQQPTEVFNSVPTMDMVVYLLMIFIQLGVFGYLYSRFFYQKIEVQPEKGWVGKAVFLLLTPGLLIVGIRGGFGQIPITISSGYYSKHMILNIAAVNPLYNIVFSTIDYSKVETSNRFHFMPDEEAEEIVENLHQVAKDTTVMVLNQERPNIVMIFLESWSGDLIESLGGLPGITPEFHELEKEGLLFTDFYASGNRSQQALASVFSGLPAIPITTLTDHPQKYNALPSLPQMINDAGYFTSFYFGGDLNYGNIKSYLVYNKFDRLVEEDQFDPDAPKGKLGVHDEALFKKMIKELGNQSQPFFTAALTLSSHSPYDQPGERPIDWIDLENEYVNSAWYTDKWLGEFFHEAKKQPWYANTLFIVLSDHSHMSYNNYQIWSFRYRHIPLLLLGGALSDEFKNTKNDHISTNMDLATTLLNQLQLQNNGLKWSKDMLNPYTPQFAYFEINEGFGWKRREGFLEYDAFVPMVLHTKLSASKIEEFKKEGSAYIQVLFQEFLDY